MVFLLPLGKRVGFVDNRQFKRCVIHLDRCPEVKTVCIAEAQGECRIIRSIGGISDNGKNERSGSGEDRYWMRNRRV